jgi:hypothetical protein
MSRNPNRRPSSLPVIAIDRIRAVARPDQLLRHDEPSGLNVSNSDAVLFELDELDPILEECIAQQAAEQEKQKKSLEASRTETTAPTNTTTNRGIPDENPAAIDAVACAAKSAPTGEGASEKLAAAIDTSPLIRPPPQEEQSRQGNELSLNSIPLHAGHNADRAVEIRAPFVAGATAHAPRVNDAPTVDSDMDESEDESERPTTTTAQIPVDRSEPPAADPNDVTRITEETFRRSRIDDAASEMSISEEDEFGRSARQRTTAPACLAEPCAPDATLEHSSPPSSEQIPANRSEPPAADPNDVVRVTEETVLRSRVDDAASEMSISEEDELGRSTKTRTTAPACLAEPSAPDATLEHSSPPSSEPLLVDEDSSYRDFEQKYMQMLNNDIIEQEEKEFMEATDQDIREAEEREALEERRLRDDSLPTSGSSPLERSSGAVESSPPERSGDSSEQREPLNSSKTLQDNEVASFDDEAIAIEEREWMARLDREISAAEEKEKENAAVEKTHRADVVSSVASSRPEKPRESTTGASSSIRQPSSVSQKVARNVLPNTGDSRRNSSCVKATKFLPRYLAGDPFITQEHFQGHFVAPFVAEEQKHSGRLIGFTAELNAVPDDSSSWLLTLNGRPETVESFLEKLKLWVSGNLHAFNYKLLLAIGVECKVEMDRSKSIGALLTQVKDVNDRSTYTGLLVSSNPEGRLSFALGPKATKCGAAVVQVDGIPCSSIDEFKALKAQKGGQKLVLVLRLHPDAELSGSLSSARSGLPSHGDDSSSRRADSPIHISPNRLEGELVSGCTRGVHLPDVAKNVSSSATQKGADQETSDGPEKKKRGIDSAAAPQESENGSGSVQAFDSKSAQPLSSAALGKLKVLAYQHFDKKFKEAAELQFKGSGIHLKFVLSQMWQQHKQKFGMSCSDDCRCVFDLPFLANTVISEKFKVESKKPDSNWRNTCTLRDGDDCVGFIGRFAAKFIPRLQKEYHDDPPPQLLRRLIAMWEVHRRNRNFGLECRDACDCSEGWDLVFRRGLIPSEDKVETASQPGAGRNDSRRPLLDSAPLRRKKAGASGSSSLIDHPTPSTENLIEGKAVLNPRALDTADKSKLPGRNEPESKRPGDEEILSSHSLPGTKKRRVDPSATLVGSETMAYGDGYLDIDKQSVSSSDDHRRSISTKESFIQRKQNESEAFSGGTLGTTNQDDPESLRGVTLERVHSMIPRQRKEYDVTFDTQNPLGFFCYTDEQQQSGVTSCKIYSVCPCGQGSTDLRIQKGTTIRAAMIGEGRYPIKSFQDIRNYYNRAAAKRSNLRVWFLNTDIAVTSLRDPSAISNEDWTTTGQWRGKRSGGWAGGATAVGSPSASPVTSGRGIRQVSTQPDYPALPGQTRAVHDGRTFGVLGSKPEQAPRTDEWVVLDTFRPTALHSQPSRSSLKGSGATVGTKRARNFRFADTVEARQFLKESRSYDFLVKSSGMGALSAAPQASGSAIELSSGGLNSRELELFDCIRHKTFQDVLRLLLNGALADSRSDKALEQMRDHLKSENSSCDKQRALYPADRLLISRKNDLKFKYLLVKIYLNAATAARVAPSLKNWVRFEILIDKIEIQLSSFAEIEGGTNALCAAVTATYDSVNGEGLIALPSKPLSSCIVYKDGNLYCMNHNANTPERALTIELTNEAEKGLKYLGLVNISLSRLLGTCTKAGGWCVIEEDTTRNQYLLNGKVTIRARRVPLERDYVDKKRNSERQRVKQTIKMIAGFNKEVSEACRPGENNHCTLPPNVTVYGGISLLHSAVSLEDEKLLKTLLDLGADPYAKGRGGQSAVSLARNMADGIVEKTAEEEILDSSHGGGQRTSGSQMEAEIDDGRKARRGRVDAISKLFHDHAHSTPDDGKDVDTSKTDYSEGDNNLEMVDRQIAASSRSTGVLDGTTPRPTMSPPLQDEMNSSSTPVHGVRLPTACNPDWIFGHFEHPKKKSLCRHWEKSGRCPNKHCHFYHVHPQPRLDFLETAARETKGREQIYSPDRNTSKVVFTTSWSSDNTLWFTAALVVKTTIHRDIFYVSGPPGSRGQDGTYWYKSQAEAETALKKVFIAARWAEKRNDSSETGPSAETYRFADSFRTGSTARSEASTPRGDYDDFGREPFHLGTRKREFHTDNPYEPGAKRQALPSSPPGLSTLPELPSRNWLGKSGVKMCPFFNKPGEGCRRGRNCHYQHVQETLEVKLPEKLLAVDPKYDFRGNIHFNFAPGGLLTAGYRNDHLNEIYYAQDGASGVRSRQGVWWYDHQQKAEQALQRVITTATLRREPLRSPPLGSGFRKRESRGSPPDGRNPG